MWFTDWRLTNAGDVMVTVKGRQQIWGFRPAIFDSLSKSVPFPRRLGHPEEYADLAVTMLRNGYFNGETVRLDGAIRMPPR